MSYSSRVYRQRNPQPKDESKEKPFFSEQKQNQKGKNNNSFFRAKPAANEAGEIHEKEADSVADTVVNQGQSESVIQQKEIPSFQRLATTPAEETVSSNDERMRRDKEEPYEVKPAEQKWEKEKKIKNKNDPPKEKERVIQMKDEDEMIEKDVQKKGEDEKNEKEIQKKEDPLMEKEKV